MYWKIVSAIHEGMKFTFALASTQIHQCSSRFSQLFVCSICAGYPLCTSKGSLQYVLIARPEEASTPQCPLPGFLDNFSARSIHSLPTSSIGLPNSCSTNS